MNSRQDGQIYNSCGIFKNFDLTLVFIGILYKKFLYLYFMTSHIVCQMFCIGVDAPLFCVDKHQTYVY